ncbi:MAG: response regulator [Pseudobdellovibrionaceae bacterium]
MSHNLYDLNEFQSEASDLLESTEQYLLNLNGRKLEDKDFDVISRLIHSLKGGADLNDLTPLKEHMQKMEDYFLHLKKANGVNQDSVSALLKGIDAARSLLEGNTVEFQFPSSPSYPISSNGDKTGVVLQNVSQLNSSAACISENAMPKVFVIDDEVDLLDAIKMMLELSKYQCHTFSSPEEFYKAIKDSPPDVILTDVRMPTCTGIDVLKNVKKINPDIPVIFMSGYFEKSTLLQTLENGAFAAVEKPFSEKNLLHHVYNAAKYRKLTKFLNRSINLLLYQFSDISNLLKEAGKEDVRRTIFHELNQLVQFRRELRTMSSAINDTEEAS